MNTFNIYRVSQWYSDYFAGRMTEEYVFDCKLGQGFPSSSEVYSVSCTGDFFLDNKAEQIE
jgi:hypothetical protein